MTHDTQMTERGCAECGKSGGWALYCLECAERLVQPKPAAVCTRTEIIALARQAGIDWTDDVFFVVNAPEMERFAQLLAQAAPAHARVECERCGRILADVPPEPVQDNFAARWRNLVSAVKELHGPS